MYHKTWLGLSIYDPTFPKIFKSQLTFPELCSKEFMIPLSGKNLNYN